MSSADNAARPCVLISDNDRQVGRTVAREARRNGFEAVAVFDGRRLVETAAATRPDLIVLDIRQNGVDGRDLLAALKRRPETAQIPVVMLTGVEDQHTRHLCLELGAADYVVKPIDPLLFVQLRRRLPVSAGTVH